MFTHAVASFDPTATGVLLWTRCTSPAPVRWYIEPLEPGAGDGASGTAIPRVLHDWCVTVEVQGLRPATDHRYWFVADDGTESPIGRTRTLPADACDELRIGVLCCTDLTMGWFGGCRAMADDDLDLVVHLGDAIYEEAKGSVRPLPGDGVATTLADYRARHAATRADPDLQALHARHPMVFVWDDHDVADNAWRHGAKAHDPAEHGPWEARLMAAAQARHDWLPARLPDRDDLLDMHRHLRAGDLLDLVVLDTRVPGRDEQPDEPGALPLRHADRTMLGGQQRAWALERLEDRSTTWAAVLSAVAFSPLVLPIAEEQLPVLDATMPSGYAIVDGEALCTDEWDGYPAERARLVQAMAERGGVVMVSGDVHSSWALEVRDADDEVAATEFVCPALTSTPMGEQLPKGWEGVADAATGAVEHERWSDLRANGWLRLTFTPTRAQADWFGVSRHERAEAGTTCPPGRPLGSWAVPPGRRSIPEQVTAPAPPRRR